MNHNRLQINAGDRFNRLTVINESTRGHLPGGQTYRRFNFICSCGNKVTIGLHWAKSGKTKSCGCLARETSKSNIKKITPRKTHGMTSTSTYRSWQQMRGRCENKSHHKYSIYGGKGIRVCDRWAKFENFLLDMGERPEKTSIGRIDNNGDYCKNNCRWESAKQQMRNTSYTRLITYNGETLCQTDWAKKIGLAPHTLVARVKRGWTPEAIVTTPRWQRGERTSIQ